MDTKRVEKLLQEHVKNLPEDPVLTEEDVDRFHAHLLQARKQRPRVILHLVGSVGLAAAALIVFVFVLRFGERTSPRQTLAFDLEVDVHTPVVRSGQTPSPDDRPTFAVRVSPSRPMFVHLLVLMESGLLLVKPLASEADQPVFAQDVEDTKIFGPYPILDDPKGILDRTTHVMVIAAPEPIVQLLTDLSVVPDYLPVEPPASELKALKELGQRIEERADCTVAIKPIPSSGP